MNATPIVVVSTLLATCAAVAVTFALRPADNSASPNGLEQLRQEVETLRTQNTELQHRLEAIGNAPAAAVGAPIGERTSAAVPTEQIAAAVQAYMQQHVTAVEASDGKGAVTFDMATEFDSLVGKSYWTNPAAWKKAFAAGRMDEVVKQFEDLAKANPNDTKVQMDLANAYMSYLQMDNSKWQYSMKADGVFDKVLALDPTHWEARFTKAVSYTFYPDFLGKKPDAIKNFETLVAQQDTMPVEASQAQTYLYLGNLLEARDPARAKEIWAKGARRHPDNAELQKKLAN